MDRLVTSGVVKLFEHNNEELIISKIKARYSQP